jgi:hypothetical protein
LQNLAILILLIERSQRMLRGLPGERPAYVLVIAAQTVDMALIG